MSENIVTGLEAVEENLARFARAIAVRTKNPDIWALDVNERAVILNVAQELSAELPQVDILDVGGGKGWGSEIGEMGNVNYRILDVLPSLEDQRVIVGDICGYNKNIDDDTFDLVFSKDTFEHLLEPWSAAQEILRITKPGGFVVIACPFSWRYHPSPVDTYRFSHTGLRYLFERSSNFKTLLAAYYQHPPIAGFWANRKDHTYDGSPFVECWETVLIGRKSQCKPFAIEDLDGDFSKDHGGFIKVNNSAKARPRFWLLRRILRKLKIL